MKRILHLSKFSHWQMGGIETAVENMLEGLSPFFHLFKVAANNTFKTKILKHPDYLEVSVPLVGLFSRTPFCPTLPYYIKRLHQRYQFSIVHLHLPNPMAHFASQILPHTVKRIISWHSDIVKQKRFLWLYQPCINRLLEKTSALIVSTGYLAEYSSQLSVARRRKIIQIIPYGISFDYFSVHAFKERSGFVREQFTNCFIVFALGRHVAYKGFNYLIKAMTHLPSNVILFLGGKGPLTPTLKKQVEKLQLLNRVYFLGEIKKDDLPVYYHACDVFCLPSVEQNEAFGIVQLEAMACSKPVVSCDVSNSMSNVNQDGITGFVVPSRSPLSLANALERFYREPYLCQILGEHAYQHAKLNFTNHLMVKRVRDLYEKF